MRAADTKRIIAWLLLLCAASCDSPAGNEASGASPTHGQPILEGSLDGTDGFASVGDIEYLGRQHCSGTKLASGWLLTAAHCLYETVNLGPSGALRSGGTSAYRVFFGAESEAPSEGYPVEAIYVHPDFDATTVWGFAHDLALLRFTDDDAFPSSCWINHPEHTIAVDYRDLKSEVAVVGYGASALSAGNGDGRRRELRTSLDWICHDPEGCHVGLGFDWVPPGSLGTVSFVPPEGAFKGDSGGPLFVFRPTDGARCVGRAIVAGLFSHRVLAWGVSELGCAPLDNPLACHSQLVVFTDVGAHADWISDCVLGDRCSGQVLP